jgi:hypothetical protein
MQFRKNSRLFFAFALMIALAGVGYGGGYWLEFAQPSASNDPSAHGAVALVRALGCGEPSKSTVTASAEGLVGGHRKSVPLQVIALATPGMYAIKGDIPKEGSWVLSVDGKYQTAETASLAVLTAQGIDRSSVKQMRGKSAAADIDALLAKAPAPKQTASR